MHPLKVMAVSEMMELCEAVEEVQVRQKGSEEELIREQEAISRASLKVGGGTGASGGVLNALPFTETCVSLSSSVEKSIV